jgi:hypothetical protein
MSFSKLYATVLASFVQQFKDAKNEKGRKTAVANAVKAVKESNILLEGKDDLPKDLPTVWILLCFLPFRFVHWPLGGNSVHQKGDGDGICPWSQG